MSWIQTTSCKGVKSYWLRDVREGRHIVIPCGHSPEEARLRKEQYDIRRDLEKEGYDDRYQMLIDADRN